MHHAQSHAVLENDRVRHFGEPVALVVAETLEQARYAASLVRVEIETEEGVFNALDHKDQAEKPDSVDGLDEVDTQDGDFETQFSQSTHKLEVSYLTGAQHASAMEPHVTVAQWDGETLIVHMAIQIVASAVSAFANTLGIDEANVRIISPSPGAALARSSGYTTRQFLPLSPQSSAAKPCALRKPAETCLPTVRTDHGIFRS